MDAEGTMTLLREVARSLGIVHISVADPASWNTDPIVSETIPEGARPLDIMPGAGSVIVMGIPIQGTILDTAPSIWYNHLYNNVNAMLDQAAERIALELGILGHDAVYIPRDGYFGLAGLRRKPEAFFSHRHSAYLAGFGTFGLNSMLINPEHGPRMRYVSVITDACLPASGPMLDDVCIRCKRCVKACPVNAITPEDYPASHTDKSACTENAAELAKEGTSPCGRCIAVCPVGRRRDRGPTDGAIDNIRSFTK